MVNESLEVMVTTISGTRRSSNQPCLLQAHVTSTKQQVLMSGHVLAISVVYQTSSSQRRHVYHYINEEASRDRSQEVIMWCRNLERNYIENARNKIPWDITQQVIKTIQDILQEILKRLHRKLYRKLLEISYQNQQNGIENRTILYERSYKEFLQIFRQKLYWKLNG